MENVYLVIFRLGGKPTNGRIKSFGQQAKAELDAYFPDHLLSFTSPDTSTLAFLISTSLKAWQVREKLGSRYVLNDDSIMVLEIGSDYSGAGNEKVQSWIKARLSRTTTARESSPAPAESKVQSKLANQLAAIKDKIKKDDDK